jgi:hypothetical protein
MLRYYTWALGQKALGLTPGGKTFYRAVGRVVKKKNQGRGGQFLTALPVVKKVAALAPASATIMDVGTGWFHKDAFLLYLAGRGKHRILLFDIADKALLHYIKNYLEDLLTHSKLLAREIGVDEPEIRERLDELLRMPSRQMIYDRCNFEPCITRKTHEPFVPSNSVDCMVSNCTLVHIPPNVLVPELRNLRLMLKDDGFMYHMLGHDDHWAFHDPSVPWPSFNYLRYSDRLWRLFFETNLEYQNRIVKPEWIDIFRGCDLDVVEYNVCINDRSRAAVKGLPSISERFARYDLDDLAIVYGYVLLRKSAAGRRNAGNAVTTEIVSIPSLDENGLQQGASCVESAARTATTKASRSAPMC